MKIDHQTRQAIDEAVRDGLVRQIPKGRRNLDRKTPADPPRVRPESVGAGRQIDRVPTLSEIEGDRE